MTDTTTTQQTQQQDRPAAQRSAREVIREHVAAVNGWCDAWGYASIQNAADFYLLDPDVRVVMRTALALRALLDAPGEVECSDATARDETNRQLREAQRLLDEEIRTAETWRGRCFKAEKERDEARKRLRDATDECSDLRESASAHQADALKARSDLADERAAHEAMKSCMKAEVKAAWTVALPEGAVSERARWIADRVWEMQMQRLKVVEQADGKTRFDTFDADAFAPIVAETLRAAEAEAAKGASGEGGA